MNYEEPRPMRSAGKERSTLKPLSDALAVISPTLAIGVGKITVVDIYAFYQ